MIIMTSKEEIECQIYSMVLSLQQLICHERLLIVISLYMYKYINCSRSARGLEGVW